MTKEEAIEMLKSKLDGKTDTSYEWVEAVRMAINALSNEDSHAEDMSNYTSTSTPMTQLYMPRNATYNTTGVPIIRMTDQINSAVDHGSGLRR